MVEKEKILLATSLFLDVEEHWESPEVGPRAVQQQLPEDSPGLWVFIHFVPKTFNIDRSHREEIWVSTNKSKNEGFTCKTAELKSLCNQKCPVRLQWIFSLGHRMWAPFPCLVPWLNFQPTDTKDKPAVFFLMKNKSQTQSEVRK